MAKVTVTNRVDRTDEVLELADELTGRGVKAGVLGEAGSTQQIKASVHEFGARIDVTPDMRDYFLAVGFPLSDDTDQIVIPERQFIRPALDNNEGFIRDRMQGRIIEAVQEGGDADSVLAALGEDLVTLIQQQMGEHGPSLSGMTLALRNGGSSATPLQDTGRLKQAISWEEIA